MHVLNGTVYTGMDGAYYLRSKVVVRVVGKYHCLLKQSTDQISFVVVGNALILCSNVVYKDCIFLVKPLRYSGRRIINWS